MVIGSAHKPVVVHINVCQHTQPSCGCKRGCVRSWSVLLALLWALNLDLSPDWVKCVWEEGVLPVVVISSPWPLVRTWAPCFSPPALLFVPPMERRCNYVVWSHRSKMSKWKHGLFSFPPSSARYTLGAYGDTCCCVWLSRWWMEPSCSRCLWWSLSSSTRCVTTAIVWRPRTSGRPWFKSGRR